MAYIGKEPVRGQNRELDDISGSFNGSNTAFTMQVGGTNTSAGSANQCFISVGGVLQNPGTDFTVAASTITFTTPPANGLDFWGVIQGDAVDINTPADDSVTGAKLAVSLVTGDTLYASGTDTLARLAKGTAGQVLKMNAGATAPEWAADAQDSTLTTQGDILYRDGSGYQRLAAGTSGYFLKTQGSGANPVWAEAGGAFTYNSTSETVYGLGNSGQDLTNANNQRCTLIGFDAGKEVTDGPGNTAVGAECMLKLTTGDYNVAVGHYSLSQSVAGDHNIAIGHSAISVGVTTGSENIAIGTNAGNDLTSGYDNMLIGRMAGGNLTTGYKNVAIGRNCLETSTNGFENIAIGWDSLPHVSYGTQCIAIGVHALNSATGTGTRECIAIGHDSLKDLTGANYTDSYGCTAVGYMAGEDVTTTYEQAFFGRQAGKGQTMNWGELWIAHRDHNKGTASVWIHGSQGGACTQGNNSSSWTTTSDERIKKNIVDNNVGLDKINQLKVRNFEYRIQVETGKDDTGHTTWAPKTSSDTIDTSTFNTLANGEKPKPHQVAINKEGLQIGMIAQEVEAVLPGCVETDPNGVKSVDTDEMFWVMVNAVKQLSAKNDALTARVATLESA